MNLLVVRNPSFRVAFLSLLLHKVLQVDAATIDCPPDVCERKLCECVSECYVDQDDLSDQENFKCMDACANSDSDCPCLEILPRPQERKMSKATEELNTGIPHLNPDRFIGMINIDDFANCTNFTNAPSFISNAPSGEPSSSLAPTISDLPSMAPSVSSAPTVDCTCCDCTHTSGCNNDPHYRGWDSVSYYDFQGSCDQTAIDNDYIQLQIRTRARNYYSTVTEAGLLMKSSGEVFNIRADVADTNLVVTSNLTVASGASYSNSEFNQHLVKFDTPGSVDSFILFRKSGNGMNVAVRGQGYIFTDSEGMFGSWNHGGVRFRNGTAFDLSGGWSGTRTRSIALAESWKVPMSESLMIDPSIVCDPSSSCGVTDEFDCTDVRRLGDSRKLDVVPGCKRTCGDITNQIMREACEEDVLLTGDKTWACDTDYVDPIIVESSQCEFNTMDDSMCSKMGDACQRLGGYCKQECQDDDEHVCVPGLCSKIKVHKAERVLKSSSKSSSSSGSSKSGKSSGSQMDACQCFVPVDCAEVP